MLVAVDVKVAFPGPPAPRGRGGRVQLQSGGVRLAGQSQLKLVGNPQQPPQPLPPLTRPDKMSPLRAWLSDST
jgi:hypothetical protein